ncbi:MAG: hypothetical protein ACI4T8_01905 [Christensenellales bacterium]
MHNFLGVLKMLYFVLKQNDAEKNETILGIAIMAIVGCILLFDLFNKSTFAPNKLYRKILLFFAFLAVFVFLVMYIIKILR